MLPVVFILIRSSGVKTSEIKFWFYHLLPVWLLSFFICTVGMTISGLLLGSNEIVYIRIKQLAKVLVPNKYLMFVIIVIRILAIICRIIFKILLTVTAIWNGSSPENFVFQNTISSNICGKSLSFLFFRDRFMWQIIISLWSKNQSLSSPPHSQT